MKNKLVLVLLSMILILSLLAGCVSQSGNPGQTNGSDSPAPPEQKQTIKIAYLPITHALPIFKTKEMLESQNSNVEIELIRYGSWPELLDALNTNNVEGASLLIELAMKAKEQGSEVQAVALGHRDGNVIMVANDIKSARDLKGKKFAIPHRQSSHNILLNDMLEEAGMTTDDLEIVEMAPPEMPSALTTGQIAGYCVAEPFGAAAVVLGSGYALYESSDLWTDSLCCGLAFTDKFIAENKETADFVLATYKEAGELLEEGDEAKIIAQKYLQQEEEVLDISLRWISYTNLTFDEPTYVTLTERVRKYGLSEAPPSYEEFIYQP